MACAIHRLTAFVFPINNNNNSDTICTSAPQNQRSRLDMGACNIPSYCFFFFFVFFSPHADSAVLIIHTNEVRCLCVFFFSLVGRERKKKKKKKKKEISSLFQICCGYQSLCKHLCFIFLLLQSEPMITIKRSKVRRK